MLAVLRAAGAHRVADLGCCGGTLLAALLADSAFTEVIGTDVSARALTVAARKLRLDRMPLDRTTQPRRERLSLFQLSLTYRDARLAVLMEVVEHVTRHGSPRWSASCLPRPRRGWWW